ncbi:MAG: tRNA pseudouridine(38-40) synthase TruA, partial [Bacilli bacterium]
MRYFITFSYDGSCFNGFQRQNGLKTVQGSLESALTTLNGSLVSICASGRTDKGVHALMQCAHFDLDRKIKAYNLKKYLNNSFDGEIYVKEVSLVSDSFHARYDALSKVYSYYINMGEFSPVNRNYQYQY